MHLDRIRDAEDRNGIHISKNIEIIEDLKKTRQTIARLEIQIKVKERLIQQLDKTIEYHRALTALFVFLGAMRDLRRDYLDGETDTFQDKQEDK
jgi:hypothetical protein